MGWASLAPQFASTERGNTERVGSLFSASDLQRQNTGDPKKTPDPLARATEPLPDRTHPGNAPTIDPAFATAKWGEPIGVTDNHLFWSVDRQEFVPISEMEIGERVQTYHGETKRIASKLPRPGPPEEVYNLEVYGEHVYFVGDEALLAHNHCEVDVSAYDNLDVVPDHVQVRVHSKPGKTLRNGPGGKMRWLNDPVPAPRRSGGWQDHHILSDKNPATMNHPLLGLAGYDLQSKFNKIKLPTTAALHPTKSIHLGKHLQSVSDNLANQMTEIVRHGRSAGFSREQYRAAINQIVNTERGLLKSGARKLNNVHHRPGVY